MDEAVFLAKKRFLLETTLIFPPNVEGSIDTINNEFREVVNINELVNEKTMKSLGKI